MSLSLNPFFLKNVFYKAKGDYFCHPSPVLYGPTGWQLKWPAAEFVKGSFYLILNAEIKKTYGKVKQGITLATGD